MTHPNPTPSILLPFMHHNLANITRTWVASSLLSGLPPLPVFEPQQAHLLNIIGPTAPSVPAHLINWYNPNTTTLHPELQPIPPQHQHQTTPSSNRTLEKINCSSPSQGSPYNTHQNFITIASRGNKGSNQITYRQETLLNHSQ